jgi:hypothetical protein
MRRAVLVLAAAVPLLAGCAVQPGDVGVAADCDREDGTANPLLVLMAQAVPTAELVPCIAAVPSSWRRGAVDVRDGRAVFAFEPSSLEGPEEAVLSVVLTASCDTTGATEVPSDQPDSRRYERLRDVVEGYRGERFYVYEGGCTTLEFRLPGENRAQQVGQASLAVDFVPRQELRDAVRERSDGRLELDARDGAG